MDNKKEDLLEFDLELVPMETVTGPIRGNKRMKMKNDGCHFLFQFKTFIIDLDYLFKINYQDEPGGFPAPQQSGYWLEFKITPNAAMGWEFEEIQVDGRLYASEDQKKAVEISKLIPDFVKDDCQNARSKEIQNISQHSGNLGFDFLKTIGILNLSANRQKSFQDELKQDAMSFEFRIRSRFSKNEFRWTISRTTATPMGEDIHLMVHIEKASNTPLFVQLNVQASVRDKDSRKFHKLVMYGKDTKKLWRVPIVIGEN